MTLRFSSSIILAAVALATLSGCSVLEPKEDPTRYFILKEMEMTPLTSNSGLFVLVGPVTLPGYLDRNEIASGGVDGELYLAEYQVWAESLEKGITRVVAGNLASLVDSPSVAPYPAVSSIDYDYRIPIIVQRFEKGVDGSIHLDVGYAIAGALASRDESEVKAASRSIAVEVTDPQSPGAITVAMSRALGDLSRDLGRDVLAAERSRKAQAAEEAAAAAANEEEEEDG
jgi:uncharacterized lipoprotein YmbA